MMKWTAAFVVRAGFFKQDIFFNNIDNLYAVFEKVK